MSQPPTPTYLQKPPKRKGRAAKYNATIVTGERRHILAETLNDICGFGSFKDAENIIERIAQAAQAGEDATTIMRRLNPPYRPAEPAPVIMDEWL